MGSLKFDSLPEDVLIQILLYKPKIKQPKKEWRPKKEWNSEMRTLLSISHTNRALRRLALSTPCLWSTLGTIVIGLKDEGVLNLFRLWIKRSGKLPLNYRISVKESTRDADELLELFFQEKKRWKSAKIIFVGGRSHVPLVRSEMTDMPNLQKLTISSVCEGPLFNYKPRSVY